MSILVFFFGCSSGSVRSYELVANLMLDELIVSQVDTKKSKKNDKELEIKGKKYSIVFADEKKLGDLICTGDVFELSEGAKPKPDEKKEVRLKTSLFSKYIISCLVETSPSKNAKDKYDLDYTLYLSLEKQSFFGLFIQTFPKLMKISSEQALTEKRRRNKAQFSIADENRDGHLDVKVSEFFTVYKDNKPSGLITSEIKLWDEAKKEFSIQPKTEDYL